MRRAHTFLIASATDMQMANGYGGVAWRGVARQAVAAATSPNDGDKEELLTLCAVRVSNRDTYSALPRRGAGAKEGEEVARG